jgi:hypothetical protein
MEVSHQRLHPFVAGGGRRRRVCGQHRGNFYAVDAGTGQLKWKFATPGERRFAAKHLHGTLPEGETMPDPFDC